MGKQSQAYDLSNNERIGDLKKFQELLSNKKGWISFHCPFYYINSSGHCEAKFQHYISERTGLYRCARILLFEGGRLLTSEDFYELIRILFCKAHDPKDHKAYKVHFIKLWNDASSEAKTNLLHALREGILHIQSLTTPQRPSLFRDTQSEPTRPPQFHPEGDKPSNSSPSPTSPSALKDPVSPIRPHTTQQPQRTNQIDTSTRKSRPPSPPSPSPDPRQKDPGKRDTVVADEPPSQDKHKTSFLFGSSQQRLPVGSPENPFKFRDVNPFKYGDESPFKFRDENPFKLGDESPFKLRDESPFKLRDESPFKLRDENPFKLGDKSPFKFRDENPFKLGDESPFKFRDENPFKLRDENPFMFRDENPFKLGDESPFKLGDENPFKFGDENPFKFGDENPFKFGDENPSVNCINRHGVFHRKNGADRLYAPNNSHKEGTPEKQAGASEKLDEKQNGFVPGFANDYVSAFSSLDTRHTIFNRVRGDTADAPRKNDAEKNTVGSPSPAVTWQGNEHNEQASAQASTESSTPLMHAPDPAVTKEDMAQHHRVEDVPTPASIGRAEEKEDAEHRLLEKSMSNLHIQENATGTDTEKRDEPIATLARRDGEPQVSLSPTPVGNDRTCEDERDPKIMAKPGDMRDPEVDSSPQNHNESHEHIYDIESPRHISNKIYALLKKPLPTTGIYIMSAREFFQNYKAASNDKEPWVKIGISVNADERKKQLQKHCGINGLTVEHYFEGRRGFDEVRMRRIEAICHLELHNFRRKLNCEVRDVKCTSIHGEWFAVSKAVALRTVMRWMKILEYDPYNLQSDLVPFWKDRIEEDRLAQEKRWVADDSEDELDTDAPDRRFAKLLDDGYAKWEKMKPTSS